MAKTKKLGKPSDNVTKAKDAFIEFQKRIKRGEEIAPLIFIAGQERLYMDLIDHLLADSLLPKEEWAFNRVILSGVDNSIDEIIQYTQAGSMLGGKRLVILRDAQDVKKLELLAESSENVLVDTTLLVIYTHDREHSERMMKKFEENGFSIAYSPLIKNAREASAVVTFAAKELNLTVSPDSRELLYELVGNNAATLYAELEKLAILVQKDPAHTISKKLVEYCVLKSREYTVYELLDNIVLRKRATVLDIAMTMAKNEKKYPLPRTLSALYNFFSNLLILLYSPHLRSIDEIQQYLGLRQKFEVKKYELAKTAFTVRHTYNIVHEIRMAEARLKGAEEGDYTPESIFMDLITFILA